MFRLVHATPVHPSLCLPHSHPTVCYYCYYCSCFTVVVPLLLLLIKFYEQELFPGAAELTTQLLRLLINFCEQELFPGAAELTTQLLRLASILWLPFCRINKLVILPAKTVAIPYTCGSSRLLSGTIAGEHSFICKFTWIYYCSLLLLSSWGSLMMESSLFYHPLQ